MNWQVTTVDRYLVVVFDDTAITLRQCDVRRRRYLLEVLAIISEFKGHEQAHARTERGQLVVNSKMVECDTAFNLVKKPHTTSSVWAHFGLKGDEKGLPIPDEIEKLVCRHCKKVVLAKLSNTSNLFSHLEDHHPEIYAELSRGKSVKRSNQC